MQRADCLEGACAPPRNVQIRVCLFKRQPSLGQKAAPWTPMCLMRRRSHYSWMWKLPMNNTSWGSEDAGKQQHVRRQPGQGRHLECGALCCLLSLQFCPFRDESLLEDVCLQDRCIHNLLQPQERLIRLCGSKL